MPDTATPQPLATVWPASGAATLIDDGPGRSLPMPDYWRVWLNRPELAPVDESCMAERALHQALLDDPLRSVIAGQIEAMRDPDVRENYRLFLNFRDAVQRAGTIEAAWAGFFRAGEIRVPPLFLDLLAQAIAARALADVDDAFQWRAAELLFRRQRVQVQEGRVLSADADTLDRLQQTGGLGSIGQLLRQAGATLPEAQVQVLGPDNGDAYLASRAIDDHHPFVLDLTHEVQQHLSHGLTLTMTRSQSGLKALAAVLERWVLHTQGVRVHITPEPRVDDPAWRWHIGLDVEASALLNDLYEGEPVDEARLARLISLFRLRFDNPAEQREDLRGKPVYLGLAMSPQGQLKLKPQNLLLNLPLAAGQ